MTARVVVVFPGQGSQRPGMGRDFAEAFPAAAAALDEASEALALDLRRLCSGDDPRLRLTEFAQPALVTIEIAMLRALAGELGLRPTHFGGHSLGEWSALVAAGVLPLAEAVRLVRDRGRLMQRAVPAGRGAMVAVSDRSLDPAEVPGRLAGLTVDLACVNAPGQVVLAGLAADVDAAVERLRGRPGGSGLSARPVAVSAPFHCRLMGPAEPAFRRLLAEASEGWRCDRAARVTSNVSGGFHTGERAALVDALTGQLAQPVRWLDDMRALAALDPELVAEVGPPGPLRGFFALLRVPVTAVESVPAARRLARRAGAGAAT